MLRAQPASNVGDGGLLNSNRCGVDRRGTRGVHDWLHLLFLVAARHRAGEHRIARRGSPPSSFRQHPSEAGRHRHDRAGWPRAHKKALKRALVRAPLSAPLRSQPVFERKTISNSRSRSWTIGQRRRRHTRPSVSVSPSTSPLHPAGSRSPRTSRRPQTRVLASKLQRPAPAFDRLRRARQVRALRRQLLRRVQPRAPS